MNIFPVRNITAFTLSGLFLFLLIVLPVSGALQCSGNGDCFGTSPDSLRFIANPLVTSGFVVNTASVAAGNPGENLYWINSVLPETATTGTFVVNGTTNLPPGTLLKAGVFLNVFHPTPQNYDSSHEWAEGTGSVQQGPDANTFTVSINTTLLYPGNYSFRIETSGFAYETSASSRINLIPVIPTTPGRKNFINWSELSLPVLNVNEIIRPDLNSYWKIVDTPISAPGEVSYGSIKYCAWDGICRVFDETGTQYYAAYDSFSITQVPNGAFIGSGHGNVTTIALDGKTILTSIDEHRFDWEG